MKDKRRATELNSLATEKANPASVLLDASSALQIASIINTEDSKVAGAVRRTLPQVARAIDLIANALRDGGRLIYVGAGTSGRIAALDAAECPPTFNTDPHMVQFVIAGGPKALLGAVEGSEDSRQLGTGAMAKMKPGKKDVVVGIAASGRTPFTVAALQYARRRGSTTIALTCNRRTPLEAMADVAIVTEVGAEVVAGSSRMKAGTAQKLVLNMLSTGAMTRLGYVYGNLMVNVHLKNDKLKARGLNILEKASGVSRARAQQALRTAGDRIPVALVMLQAEVNRADAQRALKASGNHVRRAIASLRAM